jgi:DNA-binding NarL/FixJ family response regulator
MPARLINSHGARSRLRYCLECFSGECEHVRPRSWEILSPREIECLRLLADGLTNKAIAGQLKLAAGTIKIYNRRLFQKLGIHTRLQAALWARDHIRIEETKP